MLFGSKAPLWRYVLGIFTLAVGARQIATLLIGAHTPYGAPLLAWIAAQALAFLAVAFGFFRMRDGLVVVGAALAALAWLLALAWPDDPVTSMGGSALLVVLAGLGLAFGRATRMDARTDAHTDGERDVDSVHAPLLSAGQAENLAARMAHLHGGSEADVSVTETANGTWRVQAHGQTYRLEPMTEPAWQAWLKQLAQ